MGTAGLLRVALAAALANVSLPLHMETIIGNLEASVADLPEDPPAKLELAKANEIVASRKGVKRD